MNRLPLFVLGLLSTVLAAGPTFAQPATGGSGYYIPPRPPVWSPYLNLVRPGGTPTQNYFGLVRPELEFRGGIQANDRQLFGTQQNLADLQNNVQAGLLSNRSAPLPVTGHPVRFMDISGYYQNRSGGTSANRNQAAPTAPTRR
jgi:hypothetical protein